MVNRLLKEFPDIVIPPSYTTRPKRPLEGAKKYHFVTKKEFEAALKQDKILEYVKEHNYLFGTDKTALRSALEKNQTILLEIEPRGAEYIKKHYPGAQIIYIAPKSIAELEKRIKEDKNRGETVDSDELKLRLQEAKKELRYKNQADFVVVNENNKIEQAYRELKDIIVNN